MAKGYCGQMLHFDLTNEVVRIEKPDSVFYRKYVGGSLMGSYYVYKGVPAGIDAFSPENVLVFATSPTTGAPVSGASRFNVTALSPLTGTLGDSQGGGFWGAELKFAGFDCVVITGRAEKPVYISVVDGECSIKDAQHLWGKNSGETVSQIKDEMGDKRVRVATIGQAGENLVRYACITNELKHYCGRNGLGAVMGSKNLKAIAVRGTKAPEMADPEAVREIARRGSRQVDEHPQASTLKKYGTAIVVSAQQQVGGLPTRNWTSGVFEGAEKISGVALKDTVLQKNEACWACAVRCKRVVAAEIPYHVDPAYGGPEYESLSSLGSYLEIDDLVTVCKANELCNKYTMDTISLGGTVAFAMECFEKGLLTTEDTHGIELTFGNGEALIQIIEKIAHREGIGNLLAEGSARAAVEIGRGAEELAIHVKGQELPAHMPEVKASLALSYASNPFGADHMSSAHDPFLEADPMSKDMASIGFDQQQPSRALNSSKARLYAVTQQLISLLDTLELCQFCFGIDCLYSVDDIVSLVRATAGWDTDLQELMEVGERRINLMRAFNAREGFSRKDDVLPQRLYQPLAGGPSDGNKIDPKEFELALDEYYRLMGWDNDGCPTKAKLEELGLEWVNGAR